MNLASALVIGCFAVSCTRTGAIHGSPAATVLFSAYGGVGMAPPGPRPTFAEIVILVDNPGPPLPNVHVTNAALVDRAGVPVATLHSVVHVVSLTTLEAVGPTIGDFAVFLNPDGVPFDGPLAHGYTLLRVRMTVDRTSRNLPVRCRLEIGGIGSSPLVINGPVNGEWPT